MIHNLSAVLGYLSGVIGVFLLASDAKERGDIKLSTLGFILGSFALAMYILLNPQSPFVGLITI